MNLRKHSESTNYFNIIGTGEDQVRINFINFICTKGVSCNLCELFCVRMRVLVRMCMCTYVI